jgi:SAM-dependent methyltransferase
MGGPVYDVIGRGYGDVRRPDPRIAAQIRDVIGAADSVVNVGAGAGAYEPDDVWTVAVEPSEVMIAQRPVAAAPSVQAMAEQLPFRDDAFDVGMATLTVHHWSDPLAGLNELQRVSRRQIVLTWDPAIFEKTFWFAREYLPRGHQSDERGTANMIATTLRSPVAEEPVLVPADCTDGFYAAYWARPEAFLDPAVRAGISAFALEEQSRVEAALTRLADDLASGEWDRRYGDLRQLDSYDAGYRLLVTQ